MSPQASDPATARPIRAGQSMARRINAPGTSTTHANAAVRRMARPAPSAGRTRDRARTAQAPTSTAGKTPTRIQCHWRQDAPQILGGGVSVRLMREDTTALH